MLRTVGRMLLTIGTQGRRSAGFRDVFLSIVVFLIVVFLIVVFVPFGFVVAGDAKSALAFRASICRSNVVRFRSRSLNVLNKSFFEKCRFTIFLFTFALGSLV